MPSAAARCLLQLGLWCWPPLQARVCAVRMCPTKTGALCRSIAPRQPSAPGTWQAWRDSVARLHAQVQAAEQACRRSGWQGGHPLSRRCQPECIMSSCIPRPPRLPMHVAASTAAPSPEPQQAPAAASTQAPSAVAGCWAAAGRHQAASCRPAACCPRPRPQAQTGAHAAPPAPHRRLPLHHCWARRHRRPPPQQKSQQQRPHGRRPWQPALPAPQPQPRAPPPPAPGARWAAAQSAWCAVGSCPQPRPPQ